MTPDGLRSAADSDHGTPAGAPLDSGRTKTARELPALTSVRFFAAFAVVLFHYGDTLLPWASSLSDPQQHGSVVIRAAGLLIGAPLDWGFRFGYLGVSLFFVLSGFILTHVYLGAERTRAVDRRRFWLARFARVYPVYFVGFVVSAPYLIIGDAERFGTAGAVPHLLAAALPALLLVHAWVAAWVPLWNSPTWSVADEAFFYAVFPWLAPWLGALRLRSRLIFAGVFWAVLMSVPIAYFALAPEGLSAAAQIGTGPGAIPPGWHRMLWCVPVLHVHEFVLGVVAAHFYVERGVSPRRADWLTAAGLALAAGVLSQSASIPKTVLQDGLLAPAFALIILGLAGGGRFATMLSGRTLIVLGEASYTLYILQTPVMDTLIAVLPVLRPDLEESPRGVAFARFALLVTLLGISVVVTAIVEKPARRWLVARFGGPRRVRQSAMAAADASS